MGPTLPAGCSGPAHPDFTILVGRCPMDVLASPLAGGVAGHRGRKGVRDGGLGKEGREAPPRPGCGDRGIAAGGCELADGLHGRRVRGRLQPRGAEHGGQRGRGPDPVLACHRPGPRVCSRPAGACVAVQCGWSRAARRSEGWPSLRDTRDSAAFDDHPKGRVLAGRTPASLPPYAAPPHRVGRAWPCHPPGPSAHVACMRTDPGHDHGGARQGRHAAARCRRGPLRAAGGKAEIPRGRPHGHPVACRHRRAGWPGAVRPGGCGSPEAPRAERRPRRRQGRPDHPGGRRGARAAAARAGSGCGERDGMRVARRRARGRP